MAKFQLHNYWRSSCSWRVRIALAWKDVEYEYVSVNLSAAGQREESYRKLNPNQRVPVLVVDGHTLAQSGAILEYLEEAYPKKPLLPADLLQRAQVRNLCGLVGCDIQPMQSIALTTKVADMQAPATDEERQALVAAWSRLWIERGLQALEEELKLCAGRYSVGDAVTLADVYLLPQVCNGRLCGVDLAAYPTIQRVVSELEQLQAFITSAPNRQPDAPITAKQE